MATPVFPGGNVAATFVPNFEASGKMALGFSRNPKDFPLNKYITLVPVKQGTGYYLYVTSENAARLWNANIAERVWPDGNDAPTGEDNTESSVFNKFLTERYCYAFRMGQKAVDQSDWNIIAYHSAMAAQQAMTGRALLVNTVVETAANYGANTADFLTALAAENAGLTLAFVGGGTGTNPVYKAVLQYGAKKINKGTMGVVSPGQLIVRLSPDTATALGESQEVHWFVAQSPFAQAQLRGDSPSLNYQWNLPEMIYGYKHVIEDTVQNSNHKGYPASPQAMTYLADSNKIAMLARPGQLVGVEGAPSFSTVHLWVYEDMTVESRQDVDNRRTQGRVIDDCSADIVAPVSGYLFTKVLTSA